MQPPAEEFRKRYLDNIQKQILNQEKSASFVGIVRKKIIEKKGKYEIRCEEEKGEENRREEKGGNKGENGTVETNREEYEGERELNNKVEVGMIGGVGEIKGEKGYEMKSLEEVLPASFPPLRLQSGRIFFDIEQALNVPVSENIRAMKSLWSG